ncbi:hypothetical protein IKF27_02325 [Candidatus Saccharibacteria bacterium]|nr:hypothetical protein [Candidatus Saccharibacteria bacterium]
MAKEQKIIIMDEEIELEEEKFVVFPKKEWTEEDIKKYLQRRAKLLRHTPSKKEIDRDKEGPRLRQVLKMFGTYEHAILASGLKLPPRPWSKYSDEELLDVIREWSKNNPNSKLSAFLLNNHPDLPSTGIIRDRFGETNRYFELAGVPHEDGSSPWRGKNALGIIPRPAGAMYNEIYHQGR